MSILTKQNLLRAAVTVAALAAAAVHVNFPSVVPDAITAGFLLLAFLPWLASLVKTVEVPGVGKIELREVERQAEEAKGAAVSAAQKADLALAGLGVLTPETGQLANQAHGRLSALAGEYNQIRSTQRSGPARTSAMTTIVSQMMRASGSLAPEEVRNALADKDAGQRLIGYAALYEHPNPGLLDDLVTSVTSIEDKPFGQYWGILAVGAVIGKGDQNQTRLPLTKKLEDFFGRLEPGTDRYYELSRILRALAS
jgi:hypothetical protein